MKNNVRSISLSQALQHAIKFTFTPWGQLNSKGISTVLHSLVFQENAILLQQPADLLILVLSQTGPLAQREEADRPPPRGKGPPLYPLGQNEQVPAATEARIRKSKHDPIRGTCFECSFSHVLNFLSLESFELQRDLNVAMELHCELLVSLVKVDDDRLWHANAVSRNKADPCQHLTCTSLPLCLHPLYHHWQCGGKIYACTCTK